MQKRRRDMDTRAYPRVASFHLVKYSVLEKPRLERKRMSSARNISGGGILFRAKEEIPVSAILELEIVFPSLPDPVKALARVVRATKTKSGEYEIGAHYLKINQSERNELIRRIEFILNKTKERKPIWKQLGNWRNRRQE